MNHYHACPDCYEDYPCGMDCTVEPDLHSAGRDFGSYSRCNQCEATMNKLTAKLNKMLKGWERVIKHLYGDAEELDPYFIYEYLGSDDEFHHFKQKGSGDKKSIYIDAGDFDLDFDRYNGFK